MTPDTQSPEVQKTDVPAAQPAPAPGTPGVGLGGFSLKPAGRKKPVNWKIVAVIAGGIVFVLFFTILLAMMVIKNRAATDQPEIDESKVKAEAVTEGNRQNEDVMGEFMEKNRRKNASQPAQDTQAQPEEPPASGTTTASAGGRDKAKTTETRDKPAQLREPEGLFSSVSRFDSSGMSQGGGGGYSGGGSSYGGTSDAEERLREFASADPAEIVSKALANQSSAGSGPGSFGTGSGLLSELGATREYASIKARRSPERKYLLKRQTRFQCVLYNGVKTDYPGFVSCYLLRPLYSSDGSVILAEAGAELTGEQSVAIKAGQSSAFTSWNELETAPDGVRTSLTGLGTDAMGRSGTDAYIDNHYGDRFGGAVMLSFIQDAFASASNMTKKSSNGYSVENSEQNAEDMASKALEGSINIPPTGYVLPGTVITVIVAQDIDFSSVYRTRASR